MSYISSDELKQAFEEDGHLSAYIEEMIDAIPAADVRPVVRGTWVPNVPPRDLRPRCTVCGDLFPVRSNFCPNCGADMMEGS